MPSTSRPTRLAPSQSTFLRPGSSGPANGVATHLPFLRIRSRTSAGAVSAKLKAIWSARPSALGEKARRVAATLPSVRVDGELRRRRRLTRPPVALAASSIRKTPSGSGDRVEAEHVLAGALPAFGESSPPGRRAASRDVDGHVRGRVSACSVIVVLSAIVSPFGETVSGSAERPAIASEMSPPPIDALCGRDALVRADQVRVAPRRHQPSRPRSSRRSAPVPFEDATAFPAAS